MPSSTSSSASGCTTPIGSVWKNGIGAGEELRKATKVESHSSSLTIEQRYHGLQLAYKHLQDELKRLQEKDFNARSKDEGQSHHVVSAQFFDVFQLSTDWARGYFKIPFSKFKIDKPEYELFRKSLDEVMWRGCQWMSKDGMNISHLVQAVVADVLSRRILLSQFSGCSEPARHQFSQIFNAMVKDNESKAYKWRATTFAAYERCGIWAPSDSFPPQSISSFRQAFYREISEEIDMIVGPIAREHFPNRGDDDERLRESMIFIEAAGALAVTLGQQAAKLVIMDKSWFGRSKREFICNDDRMKGRFSEESEESEEGFQVDIILRPGFLKYGNDEGEDLEKYAVWVPAMLDLSEEFSYEDAQESTSGDVPRNSAAAEQSNRSRTIWNCPGRIWAGLDKPGTPGYLSWTGLECFFAEQSFLFRRQERMALVYSCNSP